MEDTKIYPVPAEDWQQRTVVAEAKVVALTARIEQEILA
jgi:hypothetical protein